MIKEKDKSVVITGHRILGKNFNRQKLKEELSLLVNQGYKYFYIGMALGFDTECFLVLEELKKFNEIYLIACIPCLGQSDKFNKKQKLEYLRMLNNADEIKFTQIDYDDFCMKKRNKYMVDNVEIVFCYLTKSLGGTYYTVKYAIENDKKIIYFKN